MKNSDTFPQLAFPDWKAPDWKIPATICSAYTTRKSVAEPASKTSIQTKPYDHFNLAKHVGDDLAQVSQNRKDLKEALKLPAEPLWLNQTHSTQVIENTQENISFVASNEVDGSFSYQADKVCVVMTADCLPVLFTTDKGDWVAATHAGWRGLVDGILLETLKTYKGSGKILAWIGPAISQPHFEVGEEVKEQFCQLESSNQNFFKQAQNDGKWLCDLAGIAERQLSKQGVAVTQSKLCSYADPQNFYSYRRDGVTGRMASLIWIKQQ